MAKQKKSKRENIKIKAIHLDFLLQQEIMTLLRHGADKFDPETGYKLARVMAKLKEEAAVYFEAQNELMQKYVDRDATEKLPEHQRKAGNVKIKEENIDEFSKKRKEMESVELDIGIPKIKMNLKHFPKLSVYQWEFLMPFFEEIVVTEKENDEE
jgi:hypothetical protein